MEQLSFSVDGNDDIVRRGRDWPTAYRILPNGMFVVTADVPGVGKIMAQSRFLYDATVSVRDRITLALAARPQEMF
jgi:hypothetical protein